MVMQNYQRVSPKTRKCNEDLVLFFFFSFEVCQYIEKDGMDNQPMEQWSG